MNNTTNKKKIIWTSINPGLPCFKAMVKQDKPTISEEELNAIEKQRQALIAQVGTLCEHLDRLVEECGHEETAVHVGDDDRGTTPVDVALHVQSFEILCLSQIKKLEVDRVVDMSQCIHVIKTQLQRCDALEGILGFDSVVHIVCVLVVYLKMISWRISRPRASLMRRMMAARLSMSSLASDADERCTVITPSLT